MKDWVKKFKGYTTNVAFHLSLTQNQAAMLLDLWNNKYTPNELLHREDLIYSNRFLSTFNSLENKGLVDLNYKLTEAGENTCWMLDCVGLSKLAAK